MWHSLTSTLCTHTHACMYANEHTYAHMIITTRAPCSLYSNNLRPEGGKAIGEALKVNTTLTSLE